MRTDDEGRRQFRAGREAAKTWMANANPETVAQLRSTEGFGQWEGKGYRTFFGSEANPDEAFGFGFEIQVDEMAKGPVVLALEEAAEEAAIDAEIAEADAQIIEFAAEIEGTLKPWLDRFEDPHDNRIFEALALVTVRQYMAGSRGKWSSLMMSLRSTGRILDIDMPSPFTEKGR